MSVKGKGTTGYIDLDSDNTYDVVSCITELKPAGYDRGSETEEACLSDAAEIDDTGDLKYTPIDATLHYEANSTLDTGLETAMTADTQFNFAIKLPYATPVYQFTQVKIANLEPESITRTGKIKRKVQLLVRAAPTYSTTAPTTS